MIANDPNQADIDINSFFDDPKNIIPELQVDGLNMEDEINKALNEALAQIDENQRLILQEDDTLSSDTQANEVHLPDLFTEEDLSDHESIMKKDSNIITKPLSPASLISDDSQSNSPKESYSHYDTQTAPEPKVVEDKKVNIERSSPMKRDIDYAMKYQKQAAECKRLKLENSSLKSAYDTKIQLLEKSIAELKNSELTRMQLMEENRHLKKTVMKLTIDQS